MRWLLSLSLSKLLDFFLWVIVIKAQSCIKQKQRLKNSGKSASTHCLLWTCFCHFISRVFVYELSLFLLKRCGICCLEFVKCKFGWCSHLFLPFWSPSLCRSDQGFFPHPAVLSKRSGRISPLGGAASHQITQKKRKDRFLPSIQKLTGIIQRHILSF